MEGWSSEGVGDGGVYLEGWKAGAVRGSGGEGVYVEGMEGWGREWVGMEGFI